MADDIVEVSAKPSLDKLFSLPESDITDQLITAIVQGYCKKYPKQIFTKINDQDTVRNILSKLNTVDESTQSDLVNGFFSLYNSSSHAKILFKAILPDLARYINHHKDSSLKDLLLDKFCDIFSIFAKKPPSNFDLLKLIMPILDTLDKERIENLTKKLKGSFKIDPKLIDSFEKHDPSFKKSEAEAIKDANILNIFKQFAGKKLTPVQNKLLIYSITPKELLPKGLLMPLSV